MEADPAQLSSESKSAPPLIPLEAAEGVASPNPENAVLRVTPLQRFFSTVLSVCLLLFAVDAILSFLDQAFYLWLHSHLLSSFRSLLGFIAFVSGLLVYLLIGLTPSAPKRFLIVALFTPVTALALIPAIIYHPAALEMIGLCVALIQVVLALLLLWSSGTSLRWPFVPASHLRPLRFSWLNTTGFALGNIFVLLPLALAYLFGCASLAIGHYSEGFLSLKPRGLFVQVRNYARGDGKTVELVPMSHIGEARFYREVAKSFPSNSLVLMEGVTDEQGLLTNRLSYHSAAKSLGLSEQQQEFKPVEGQWVSADVDVSDFSSSTIGFLNMVSLLYKKGLNIQTLPILFQPAPPELQHTLIEDVLYHRNRHVVQELKQRLPEWDSVVIPWGAAHMPGLSQEIQKLGFRGTGTNTIMTVRFGR